MKQKQPADVLELGIERVLLRESQLWWLAVLIISLLAATIFALGISGVSVSGPLSMALDTVSTRVFLLLATFLICAYFREKTKELRQMNQKLVDDLVAKTDDLARRNEELRKTQAELVQSAKLASIGELAGGVAHEINNPLTVILGRTQLALEDAQDEATLDSLRIVASETERISGIVRNLLSFSRQNKDRHFEPVRVEEVLQRTVQLLGNEPLRNQTSMNMEMEPDAGEVLGNAGQLQQVFTNIIINASQAMPNGGSLDIRVWRDNGRVRVSFIDSGPGMDNATIEHIFDPFFTTKREGTGLGLSVSYGIVRDHAGEIAVDSELGQGTTFTISLPALDVQARAA